jgi:hypothetical protein
VALHESRMGATMICRSLTRRWRGCMERVYVPFVFSSLILRAAFRIRLFGRKITRLGPAGPWALTAASPGGSAEPHGLLPGLGCKSQFCRCGGLTFLCTASEKSLVEVGRPTCHRASSVRACERCRCRDDDAQESHPRPPINRRDLSVSGG